MLFTKQNKVWLVVTLICLSLLPSLRGNALQYQIITYELPENEEIDLLQTGNLTHPYIANITLNYDFILQYIFLLNFTGNNFNIQAFGNDPILANGINVLYAGTSLINNDNYTRNDQFFHRSIEGSEGLIRDDINPKDNLLKATIDLTKQAPNGLFINSNTIQFYIQDDLTSLSSVKDFRVTILGYKNVQEQVIQGQTKQDPADWITIFLRDNSATLTLIGVGIIGPTIAWVFWRKRR